jgi:DNA polymerase
MDYILKYDTYTEFEKAKSVCKDCVIGKIYNKVVCSDGCKINPVVLISGEGPGSDELIFQKPFVGEAGQLLRPILNKFGFRKSNTIISNVIPCRPENNKFPEETNLVKSCFEKWMVQELLLLKPKYLLLLGNQPLKYFLDLTGITKYRGNWLDFKLNDCIIKCMPTYHPAFVLRKRYMEEGKEIMKDFESDIETLGKEAKLI